MLCLSRFWVVTVLAGLVLSQSTVVHAASDSSEELSSQWPSWGASPEGTRYSAANQITPDNVEQLQVAWTYSTGELKRRPLSDVEQQFVGNHTYSCSRIIGDLYPVWSGDRPGSSNRQRKVGI